MIQPPPVYGLGILKALLVVIALALFAIPWLGFAKETFQADAPVNLNDGLVYLANLSAGVLASAFAIALGVKAGPNGRSLGTSLTWPGAPDWAKLALTVCVWIYFVVGAVVLGAYVHDLRRDTSFAPSEVADFALLFTGYAVGYLAVLLGIKRR